MHVIEDYTYILYIYIIYMIREEPFKLVLRKPMGASHTICMSKQIPANPHNMLKDRTFEKHAGTKWSP